MQLRLENRVDLSVLFISRLEFHRARAHTHGMLLFTADVLLELDVLLLVFVVKAKDYCHYVIMYKAI